MAQGFKWSDIPIAVKVICILWCVGVVCCAPFWLFFAGGRQSKKAKPPSASLERENPLSAQLVSCKIVPWDLPNGGHAQMVLINWQNTGDRPIGALWVSIQPFDAAGHPIGGGNDKQCVFAADRRSQKIQPHQAYNEPYGNGYVLFPELYGEAERVEARIVRIDSESNDESFDK